MWWDRGRSPRPDSARPRAQAGATRAPRRGRPAGGPSRRRADHLRSVHGRSPAHGGDGPHAATACHL